jgi:hypothetical protein
LHTVATDKPFYKDAWLPRIDSSASQDLQAPNKHANEQILAVTRQSVIEVRILLPFGMINALHF